MRIVTFLILFLVFGFFADAQAQNACSGYSVQTEADVTVSDGTSYGVQAYFKSKKMAALHFVRDDPSTVAIEGNLSWRKNEQTTLLGNDRDKVFVLGHQFHALLLDFEGLTTNHGRVEHVIFNKDRHSGRTGDLVQGTRIYLFDGTDPARPVGMRFHLGEETNVDVIFQNWKKQNGTDLPNRMIIDDGNRVFTYNFTKIDLSQKSPDWFYSQVPAPELDVVQIHRLHRRLLIAHCLGDAEMLANLATPEVLSANGGEVSSASREMTRSMFENVFNRRKYSECHDLTDPVIEVAESGDLGWIAANPRAVGHIPANDQPFDETWAWIMPVKKIDGKWLFAGTASNVRPPG